ncbi:nucleotidyltransferase family protein [Candidatus Cetobacterium colombiensis]|uniref:Nucleotidyltransferase domain-containing protein n=1 Tax=Candidatus Cetobacterium colombiensis TaxID=3073100 RepID=A0ABU4WG00_9FUSO|nr:nucleotidyltransferase domain-containing protein [Candidatus Cetobacterium colombiensis]MDX8337403.1 nucleotidyltransferase domain-containing protein [Candidatus Cetobacterium colombiensis]
MIDKSIILNKLSTIDKSQFGISKIGLFGSYSKDEQTEKSDIDIFVELIDNDEMLTNFYNLKSHLESTFSKKIDLVTSGQFDYKYKNPLVAKYKEKVKNEILGSVIYV